MKKILLTLLVAFLALPVFSQEHLKFKGIPMDGNVNGFISKLKAAGFKEPLADTQGSIILEGDFAGMADCMVLIMTTADKTPCKILVNSALLDSWASLKYQYNKLKQALAEKYTLSGDPAELFIPPYKEGDGSEMYALHTNNVIYCCFFDAPGGSVTLEIRSYEQNSRRGIILLTYEDDINFAKYQSELKKSISDDL